MRSQSTRTIRTPAAVGFRVIVRPSGIPRAIGADPNVEFLSERRSGVGTRFKASRTNKGKAMTFEHEVIEYVPGFRQVMMRLISRMVQRALDKELSATVGYVERFSP